MYFPATPIPKESPSEGISLDGHFIPPGIPIAVSYGSWQCIRYKHVISTFCGLAKGTGAKN